MKLIVGLGNPGKKYKHTRHNVGYLAVDRLISKIAASEYSYDKYDAEIYYFQSKNVILAKPLTFMNESGKSVKKIVDQFKVKAADLWVIHDDLDIALGEYKIQSGKGPKDHKGIISIEKTLGKKDFKRVRIGVENRSVENKISGESYVLKQFTQEELKIINKTVMGVSEEIIKKCIYLKD